MDVGELLPPRSVEDILAERVRLVIDGRRYDLPALVIDHNETWKAQLDATFTRLLDTANESGEAGPMFDALAQDAEPFLDLLASYDTAHGTRQGVLPDRAVIRATTTPLGLLCAVLEVWRAANPLVDIGIDVWTMTVQQTSEQPRRTRRSRPSTAGPSATSGVN